MLFLAHMGGKVQKASVQMIGPREMSLGKLGTLLMWHQVALSTARLMDAY